MYSFCWMKTILGMLYKAFFVLFFSFFFQYISIVLVHCVIPQSYCHAPYFDVVMTKKAGEKDDQLTDTTSEKALTIDCCLRFILLITTHQLLFRQCATRVCSRNRHCIPSDVKCVSLHEQW